MDERQQKPKKGDAPYNQHMKRTIKKIKDENPGIHHRDAFCQAAEQWKTSPANPKNKDKNGAGSSTL
eukprot:IDg2278t1